MFDTWGDYEQTAGTVDTVPESRCHDPLPESLAGRAPGAELGTALASIDRDRLSGHDRVIVMQAWSRQVAHAQAELYASMTAVAEAEAEAFPDDDPFDLHDVAVSEVRAALTWTRRAAEFNLSFAHNLVEGYPEVWAALHRGRIDLPKSRVSSTKPVTSIMTQRVLWPTKPWSVHPTRPPDSCAPVSRDWSSRSILTLLGSGTRWVLPNGGC